MSEKPNNLIKLLVISKKKRIFDFVEDTHARKYSNKFGISLAYLYLCSHDEKSCSFRNVMHDAAIIKLMQSERQGGIK